MGYSAQHATISPKMTSIKTVTYPEIYSLEIYSHQTFRKDIRLFENIICGGYINISHKVLYMDIAGMTNSNVRFQVPVPRRYIWIWWRRATIFKIFPQDISYPVLCIVLYIVGWQWVMICVIQTRIKLLSGFANAWLNKIKPDSN